MCVLGLSSISSCLICWFHISLLAVDIPTLDKAFSLMPEHIVCFCPGYTSPPHAFLILALISLIECTAMVIDCHHLLLLNRLITAALCFHFVYSFRVEALFKQATYRHANLCWVWLKSEESECYKDLQDNDALSCESFVLWTIDKTKMHPEGTTGLFTLIEPVCKEKMLALCCIYRFL